MNGCDIGFGTPRCTSIRKKYCFAQLNSDFIFFLHIQSIYIVSKENQTAGGK